MDLKKLTVREYLIIGTALITVCGTIIKYLADAKYNQRVVTEMTNEITNLKNDIDKIVENVNWIALTMWIEDHPDEFGPPTPPPNMMIQLNNINDEEHNDDSR